MTSFCSLDEQDFDAVMNVLKEADIPIDGITPQSLSDFIGLRVDCDLVAIAGLERYSIVSLLRSVAIRSEFRCSGIGKRLVAALENHARTRDVLRLVLLTTTAERFFIGLGTHLWTESDYLAT